MVVLQVRGKGLPHSLVVGIDVVDVGLGQQFFREQVFIVGAKSEVLEVVEAVFLVDEQHVFNSDAVLSWFVITGFVCDDHSCLVLCLIVLADSNWTLVNALEIANSVASAMTVVESLRPKMSPCQNVDICSGHLACWPVKSFNVKISEQDASERVSFLGSWVTEVESSGDISSSVEVLSS